MDSFLSDVSILIEEMDSLPMKILIRKKAKKLGIPVLMATDNGNSVILDVERFDNDHDYPVFHGRVDLMKEGVLLQSNQKQWNRIASEIIGIEFMEENLLLSLAKVGYTISGIPQLASAATSSGAFLAICVVRIATQKTLFSGKYVFSTEAILVPNYLSTASIKRREDIRENFKKFLRS
jgi:hypothetical protein